MDSLFERVVSKSPASSVWIGSTPAGQMVLASSIIVNLCCREDKIRAAAQVVANNILDPRLDLSNAPLFTAVALPMILLIAKNSPSASKQVPNAFRVLDADSTLNHRNGATKFLTMLLRDLGKSDSILISGSKAALKASLEEIKLEISTPDVISALQATRGMRL